MNESENSPSDEANKSGVPVDEANGVDPQVSGEPDTAEPFLRLSILTGFPGMFTGPLQDGMLRIARESGRVESTSRTHLEQSARAPRGQS